MVFSPEPGLAEKQPEAAWKQAACWIAALMASSPVWLLALLLARPELLQAQALARASQPFRG